MAILITLTAEENLCFASPFPKHFENSELTAINDFNFVIPVFMEDEKLCKRCKQGIIPGTEFPIAKLNGEKAYITPSLKYYIPTMFMTPFLKDRETDRRGIRAFKLKDPIQPKFFKLRNPEKFLIDCEEDLEECESPEFYNGLIPIKGGSGEYFTTDSFNSRDEIIFVKNTDLLYNDHFEQPKDDEFVEENQIPCFNDWDFPLPLFRDSVRFGEGARIENFSVAISQQILPGEKFDVFYVKENKAYIDEAHGIYTSSKFLTRQDDDGTPFIVYTKDESVEIFEELESFDGSFKENLELIKFMDLPPSIPLAFRGVVETSGDKFLSTDNFGDKSKLLFLRISDLESEKETQARIENQNQQLCSQAEKYLSTLIDQKRAQISEISTDELTPDESEEIEYDASGEASPPLPPSFSEPPILYEESQFKPKFKFRSSVLREIEIQQNQEQGLFRESDFLFTAINDFEFTIPLFNCENENLETEIKPKEKYNILGFEGEKAYAQCTDGTIRFTYRMLVTPFCDNKFKLAKTSVLKGHVVEIFTPKTSKLYIENEGDLQLLEKRRLLEVSLKGYSNGYFYANDIPNSQPFFIKVEDINLEDATEFLEKFEIQNFRKTTPPQVQDKPPSALLDSFETRFAEKQSQLATISDLEQKEEYRKYVLYIRQILDNAIKENFEASWLSYSQEPKIEVFSAKLSKICNKIYFSKEVRRKNPQGMLAHPVQILAVLKLLEGIFSNDEQIKGTIGEIKTGEGKSFVIALTSIVAVSFGRKIDIVTQNMQLAARDLQEQKIYYDIFKITSECLYDKTREKDFVSIDQSTIQNFEDDCQFNTEVLNSNVVYSTNSNFEWLFLRQTFSNRRYRNRPYDVCIVDEIDNILLDQATSPALLANNFPIKNAEKIFKTVYVLASQNCPSDYIKLKLQQSFPDAKFLDKDVELLITAANEARIKVRDVDYVLKNDRISVGETCSFKGAKKAQIIDENTGFIKRASRWNAYIHEMIEIKEGLKFRSSSVTRCAVSQLVFFNMYKNLCGVTGTIGSEHEHELFRRHYNVEVFKVPTNWQSKVRIEDRNYLSQRDDLFELIAAETRQKISEGRPVLVILDSVRSTNDFCSRYFPQAKLIQGIKPKKDKKAIENAGLESSLTVATIAAGRGTDIKLTSLALKNGGLHVIISKLPLRERTLIQTIGRAGRQGQPGTATVYIDETGNSSFSEISSLESNTFNLFKLQTNFSTKCLKHWPWLLKTSKEFKHIEYQFGTQAEDTLRMNASTVVDDFYWPEKIFSSIEIQNCTSLLSNMLLTSWGNFFTQLDKEENSRDIRFCEDEYRQFLGKINEYFPKNCYGPKDIVLHLAKKTGIDKEIHELLYKKREEETIIDHFNRIFQNRHFQKYVQSCGENTKDFMSNLKYLPQQLKREYIEHIATETAIKEKQEVQFFQRKKQKTIAFQQEMTRKIQEHSRGHDPPREPPQTRQEQQKEVPKFWRGLLKDLIGIGKTVVGALAVAANPVDTTLVRTSLDFIKSGIESSAEGCSEMLQTSVVGGFLLGGGLRSLTLAQAHKIRAGNHYAKEFYKTAPNLNT
ncbi:MAG: hypothetical protein LBF33_01675 [Oscillospiraceae bacterium]|nr:hypothetical protein [Oscillospiraceae bacterium]